MVTGVDVGPSTTVNIKPLSYAHIQEKQGSPITVSAQLALIVAAAYIKTSSPQQGIAGLPLKIEGAAVQAEDLPKFLQDQNLNLSPLQLARVILGIDREIHGRGNTSFTFTRGQILSWAGDKSLDQHLTNLCLTLQKNKNNPASLFAVNSPKSQGLLPSVHVPGGDNPVAPLSDSEEAASGGVEVAQQWSLIALAASEFISPEDLAGAQRELELIA